MYMHRSVFLELSSELSGYPSIDLEGTGLVDQYHQLVNQEIGQEVSGILIALLKRCLSKKAMHGIMRWRLRFQPPRCYGRYVSLLLRYGIWVNGTACQQIGIVIMPE